jgi:hypothetical protein
LDRLLPTGAHRGGPNARRSGARAKSKRERATREAELTGNAPLSAWEAQQVLARNAARQLPLCARIQLQREGVLDFASEREIRAWEDTQKGMRVSIEKRNAAAAAAAPLRQQAAPRRMSELQKHR